MVFDTCDHNEIIFYSLDDNKEINRKQLSHSLFSISDNKYLIYIDNDMELHFYDIIFKSG